VGEGVAFDQEKVQKIIFNLCFSTEEERLILAPRRKRKRIIVISGPTGCGKTALSLIIAKAMGGEVVSADSMQVYRGMDIGTAKIPEDQRQGIPHHLLDVCDVKDPFNVVDFYYDARNACDSICARDKVPLVVGGSGFYLRSFLYGPPSGPPSIPMVREALEEDMNKFGPQIMYERLAERDPDYASTIMPNDKHKIIRALEIVAVTGDKVSSFSWRDRQELDDYEFCCWFLHSSRSQLYGRIDERCDEMLEAGLVEEVNSLIDRGICDNPSASQAIGYRHCLDYLKTEQTAEDYSTMVRKFKTASRHYAKRQFTWFRKEPTFRWISVEDHDLETVADIIMNDYSSRMSF
jgi:tRNA dimethylallyltransferase